MWYCEALKFRWEFRRNNRLLLARGIGEFIEKCFFTGWLSIDVTTHTPIDSLCLRVKGKTEVKDLVWTYFLREIVLWRIACFFFFKLISFRVFWFVLVSTCIGVYEVIEVISYVLV